jgi:hypothetical protein
VALAVIVENAGFGSVSPRADRAPRVRLPAARARYPSEEDMALTREGRPAAPVGKPRPRAEDAHCRPAPPAASSRGGSPMSTVFERPSLARTAPVFAGLDGPLLAAVLLLMAGGLLAMYSAGFDHGTRFVDHGAQHAAGAAVLFVVAQVPPQKLQRLAVPLYTIGWRCWWPPRCSASRARARRAG